MKKHFVKSLAVLMTLAMILGLAACGGSNSAPTSTSSKQPSQAPSSNKVYEIRLASTQADGNDLDKTLDLFAKLAGEKSNGRLKITVYPGTVLGDELTTTEMCQQGQLEMTMTSTGVLANFCPEFSITTLPGLFKSYDHLVAATRSDWGKSLGKATKEQEMVLLGYTCNGFMNIGTVKTPVASIADLSGLNIRCIESKSTIAILSEWGCNPVPMAFSEVPTSLQLGAINGCFLNPLVFLSTGIADIMDYYTADWSVGIGLCPVLVNATFFDSLPEDLQTIIRESFTEAEDDGFRRTKENQDANLKKLEEKGVKLVHSTPKELAEVNRINQEVVWPKLIEMGLASKDAIDQIQASAK